MEALAEVGSIATETAGTAWIWAGNFVALIILTALLLVFAMRGGRSGLISLMISFYVGYAIYMLFPFAEIVVGAGGTPLIKAILSVGMFILATLVPFLVIRRITGGGFGSLSFFQNLLLSLLTSAFLIALGYHVFDIHQIYTFPAPMDQLFAPEGFFFYWFIAPLLGLFIFAR
jgi:hypothetical protein